MSRITEDIPVTYMTCNRVEFCGKERKTKQENEFFKTEIEYFDFTASSYLYYFLSEYQRVESFIHLVESRIL